MSDAVNKPTHYNQGSIECIDAMKIVLTQEEFRGYLKGNVFKYLWREKDKNGNEDLRKGKSYYDSLIELVDESEQQKAADLQSLKDHPFGKLKTGSLNSDTIPEGYRKLGDSLIEQRQPGDLRWSIIEEGYIPISGDEIVCANRDNWAACRKITEEVTGEGTGEVKPPDGWRWLEFGEKFFFGDTTVDRDGKPYLKSKISKQYCERHTCQIRKTFIRRNRFEVGEKVVHGFGDRQSISAVENILGDGWVDLVCDGVSTAYHVKDLAPYIEEST